MSLLDRVLRPIARGIARMIEARAARSQKSRATEILTRMRLSAATFDIDAFSAGADDLMDDSVRLMYNAKLAAMTRARRREMRAMDADEAAAWLYDMCVDTIQELPPLRVRMMLSAACGRHARTRP